MKPSDRENLRYLNKEGETFSSEEKLVFSLIDEFIPSAKSCLDLGCGSGQTLLRLSSKYESSSLIGIDFSSVATEQALANNINAINLDFDAKPIPLPTESQSLITALDVIEHVFDPISLLTQSYNLLTSGGYLFGIVPNDLHYITRLRALFGISPVSRTYRKLKYNKHHTLMSSELLSFFLSESGFNVSQNVRLYYVSFLMPGRRFLVPFNSFPFATLLPGSIIFYAKK